MLFDSILSIFGLKDVWKPLTARLPSGTNLLSELQRRRIRILVAEDNDINRQLVVSLLSKQGYQMEAVENGTQAIERLEAEHFDLVLMDIQMPELDGFDATRKIRMQPGPNQNIPIIALTAHAMAGDEERCLAAGMDGYLPKPLEPDTTFKLIDKLVRGDLREGELILPEPTETRGEPAAAMYQVAPIELENALPRFSHDMAFFTDLLGVFLESADDKIEELKDSAHEKKYETLAVRAHNLKGVAKNFSAVRLAAACEKLFDAANAPNHSGIEKLIKQVEDAINELERYQKALVEEN
jgi:polar amino acid transport system substrate-binding protein